MFDFLKSIRLLRATMLGH